MPAHANDLPPPIRAILKHSRLGIIGIFVFEELKIDFSSLEVFIWLKAQKNGFFIFCVFSKKNWRFPAKKPSTAPPIDSFVELLKTSSDCHLLLSSEKYIYLYKRLEFYLHNWHEI